MQYQVHIETEDARTFLIARDGQHTIGLAGATVVLTGTNGQPVQATLILSSARLLLRPEQGAHVAVNGQVIDRMIALRGDETLTIGGEQLHLRLEELGRSPSEDGLPFRISSSGEWLLDSSIPTPVPPVTLPNLNKPSIQPISRAVTDEPDQVSFTAYYPRNLEAETRGGLYVYAHLADATAQIARDVQKFVEELGGEVPRARTSSKTAQIKIGTPVTISIECDTVEFDPPSLTRRWDDEWVRFAFDFKLKESLVGEQIIVQIVIQVHSIEVARIGNCAIEVLPPPRPSSSIPTILTAKPPANALAAAKYNALGYDEARLYQKIFVSYSRADSEVVQAYQRAQEALGNEVFVDTYSIRSGTDWQVALATAIDEADVLQLFWSDKSALSANVRDEWDYALNHRCKYDGCRAFIRPVYWTKPLPAVPPAELNHLNFRFVALGNIENTGDAQS